jgi:hypothetical protein
MEEFAFALAVSDKSDPTALPSNLRLEGAGVFVHGLSLEGALWPGPHQLGTTRGAVQPRLGGVEGVGSGGWLEPRLGSPHQLPRGGRGSAAVGSTLGSGGSGGGEEALCDPRARRLQPLPICLLTCALPEPDPFPEDPAPTSQAAGDDAEHALAHAWREDADLLLAQRETSRRTAKALAAASGAALASLALAAADDAANAAADSSSALPPRRTLRVPVFFWFGCFILLFLVLRRFLDCHARPSISRAGVRVLRPRLARGPSAARGRRP